ncbi:MAG: hypothetical protein WAW46_07075 [Polaromonas sp.]
MRDALRITRCHCTKPLPRPSQWMQESSAVAAMKNSLVPGRQERRLPLFSAGRSGPYEAYTHTHTSVNGFRALLVV